MEKSIYQRANGNVENMVAGDQHNHYYTDPTVEKRIKSERCKMRTTLLQYKDGKFPAFHNLLCDYAKLHFGDGKFTELTDEQLTKLYQYHQTILFIADKLAAQKSPTEFSLKRYVINRVKRLFTKE